ncbi:MAG: TIGR02391 family protein [Acidobacteriota bacterium]|nr:TIGR02391 family protein [Acidobacteriota bacterium]
MQKRRNEIPQIVDKIFSMDAINSGIEKLKRRIAEVETLDPQRIPHDDATVDTAKNNIRDTVREVFGQQSQEANDFRHPEIYSSGDYMPAWDEDPEHQSCFARGILQIVKSLNGLIAKLEEKRIDLAADPTAQAQIVFEGMMLHPRIAAVCSELYRNGHYPQAVFDASKALVNFVKERSGRHDLDGVGLMTTVFSKNNSVLAFNSLTDQSDKDEQEGMMHLFMGVVLGVRNPRGHSFLTDSPEDALEFIGLLSLLANRVEKAKHNP